MKTRSFTLREAFARLDDDTLEAVRHAAEDEIRDRDISETENELGTEWPVPSVPWGEERSIADYRARSLHSLFDLIFRGAENG